MKLKIQQWIDEANYSKEVKYLFDDSFICFKAGAYRASLLFSYLGFLTLLKERILNANSPFGFEESEWNNILQKLSNEDAWEKEVFEASQRKPKTDQQTGAITKAAIFSISENIRLQIMYWKDRRNDCAHYKDNEINSFHVESFWAFLQSNLHKITVEGGMQSLLNKFEKHFDLNYTAPGADVLPLIVEINNSIEYSSLIEFWNQLITIVEPTYIYFSNGKMDNIFVNTLEKCNDKVKSSLIEFLKSDESLLFIFLSEKPDKIILFNFSEEEVRNIWRTKLKRSSKPADIFAYLLLNNLIPKSEIEEAIRNIFDLLRDYPKDNTVRSILKSNGFDKIFNQIVFLEKFGDFLWVNGKADFINEFIEVNGFSKLIVEVMCNQYSRVNYSRWLLERIEKLFKMNTSKREEFLSIAQENSFTIPTSIQEILN